MADKEGVAEREALDDTLAVRLWDGETDWVVDCDGVGDVDAVGVAEADNDCDGDTLCDGVAERDAL